jgi:glycine cleavage system H protein
MAFIEKFLGKRVEIPEDRRYYAKQGLWANSDGKEIVFGLSEPALVLLGGVNDVDFLVTGENRVQEGESVIFATTGKILYIDSPVKGLVHFNPEIKKSPEHILNDPYGKGWLFRIDPEEPAEEALHKSADANGYIESLKGTEGFKNPEGLKGGVSGICKAVYTGIREQKI